MLPTRGESLGEASKSTRASKTEPGRKQRSCAGAGTIDRIGPWVQLTAKLFQTKLRAVSVDFVGLRQHDGDGVDWW